MILRLLTAVFFVMFKTFFSDASFEDSIAFFNRASNDTSNSEI